MHPWQKLQVKSHECGRHLLLCWVPELSSAEHRSEQVFGATPDVGERQISQARGSNAPASSFKAMQNSLLVVPNSVFVAWSTQPGIVAAQAK